MTRRIWTHAEVEEVKERWKHPDTPIHIGEPVSEEKWNRFVLLENIKDGCLVAFVAVGFAFLVFYEVADLTKQHGIAVPVSLVLTAIAVLVFSHKRKQ